MNDKTEQELLEEFIQTNIPEEKDFITLRKKETLPTGYLLNSKKIVHPHYSYYDPEGEFNLHIWAEGRCYRWGIEIEARYTGQGEGTPKIRKCDHIGPKLHVIFKELPLL